MAERIVSPGVFTREKDLSFLPQGVAAIGAAVIGTTQKGPAFWPTQVTSYTDFENKFGGLELEPTTYLPHTVREYFEQGGTVMTVVRILGADTVTVTNPIVLKANHKSFAVSTTGGEPLTISSSTQNSLTPSVLAVLYPTEFEDAGDELDHGSSRIANTNRTNYVGAEAELGFGASSTTASFTEFALHLSGSGQTTAGDSISAKVSGSNPTVDVAEGWPYGITASLVGTNNNSIDNVLGFTPKSTQEAYVKYYFKNFTSDTTVLDGGNTVAANLATGSIATGSAADGTAVSHVYAGGFKSAYTPWITNQYTNSAQTNLFKLHHLGHGETTNYEFKVAVLNMKPNNGGTGTKYVTFDLQIRTVKQEGLPFESPYTYDADDDNSANVVEEFTGLTLDPRDNNYIARVIGDRYYQINDEGKVIAVGTYPNQSRYVRVEVSDAVKTQGIPTDDAPFGHQAYYQTIPSTLGYFPSASITTRQGTADTYDAGVFYGFDFGFASNDNWNYLGPIPSTAGSVGTNTDFNLSNMKGHVSVSEAGLTGNTADDTESITMTDATHQLQRRFMVAFQGGQEGIHPARARLVGKGLKTTNSFGFDFTDSTSNGTKAWKRAINALSNADEFDINLLTLPGIIHDNASSTINHAIAKVEDRGDCFLIFDVAKYNDSVSQTVSTIIADAISDASGYDSSYAATYFPWLMYNNAVNNVVQPVPPSAMMPSVFVGNDTTAEPWFAPAGLTRGLLTQITEATTRLTHAERDDLYEAKVNPIATFPNQGVCVWGQKTLQTKRSALDRINVRRLLIALKKFIASTSRFLVFEQNTAATRNRFLGIVNPYLESVQQRSGLHAFKVVMDTSNNTPDVIDRNRLVGNIMLQPTRTAEFIVLDFTVLPTGATFPE